MFYAVSDPHMASDCAFGCGLGTVGFPRDWKRVIRFRSVVEGAMNNNFPLLVAGDLTDHGYDNEWILYKSVLGDRQDGTYYGWTEPRVEAGTEPPLEHEERAYRWVYDGTGNHDVNIDPVGNAYDCIRAWVSVRAPCVGTGARERTWPVSTCLDYFPWATDQNCPHYSFDYNGLHIVQLNIFPGDDPPIGLNERTRDPLDALIFLKEDLARRASDGRRVVIVHHYEIGNRSWWNQEQENAYIKALEPYNVAAIIYGHSHGDPSDTFYLRGRDTAGSRLIHAFLAGSIVEADDPARSGLGGAFSEYVIRPDSIEQIRYSIHPETGAWSELSRQAWPINDRASPQITDFEASLPQKSRGLASDASFHVEDHDAYAATAKIRTLSRGWAEPASGWTDLSVKRGACGGVTVADCIWSWPRTAAQEDGWYEVEYSARDVAAHVTTETRRFAIDSTPPEISVEYSPRAPTIHGWLREPTAVTLTVHDGSGIGLASVGCAGVDCPVLTPDGQGTFSGSRVYSDEGERSFTIEATDEVGNKTERRVDVRIDSTPPRISATRTQPNERGWNAGDVRVDFTCKDDESGLSFCSEGETVSSEGAGQSRQGTAFDKAGNAAEIRVGDINIDKTSPEISGSRSPEANGFGWNNTAVGVEFDCDDAVSGILACLSRLSGDFTCANPGAPPTGPRDCRSTGELSTEGGEQSVDGQARDLAGNAAESVVGPISIDLTPPTITIVQPQEGQSYLAGSALEADYECEDEAGGSGIDVCQGTTGDGEAIDTSEPGDRTFTVDAKDRADNAASRSVRYRVSCGARAGGPLVNIRVLFPFLEQCP